MCSSNGAYRSVSSTQSGSTSNRPGVRLLPGAAAAAAANACCSKCSHSVTSTEGGATCGSADGPVPDAATGECSSRDGCRCTWFKACRGWGHRPGQVREGEVRAVFGPPALIARPALLSCPLSVVHCQYIELMAVACKCMTHMFQQQCCRTATALRLPLCVAMWAVSAVRAGRDRARLGRH